MCQGYSAQLWSQGIVSAGSSWQESQGQSLYSRFTASSVFPWQQATEVTRYGCVSSSCTGLGTPVSSSFLPRRPLAPFPHVHTSPSAEGYKHLTAHLPWPQPGPAAAHDTGGSVSPAPMATVKASPQATTVTFIVSSPTTRWGTRLLRQELVPSCPCWLLPKV